MALRKPGNDDYTNLKAYRLIALLNTLGKNMESIMATRISYPADTHNLLPETHIGGRTGKGTEQAMHLLIEKIHAAWIEGKAASLLMLDITGAYDNVSHERLTHNLRKRRIPEPMVNWILSFLSEMSKHSYRSYRTSVNTLLSMYIDRTP